MLDTDAAAGPDADASTSDRLRTALDEANIPTLLMVLAQLTGDERWLQEPYRPRRGLPLDDNDSGGLSEELQREIRAAAFDTVVDYRAGRLTPVALTPTQVAEMLEVAMVEEVPREYGALLSEELGLTSRDVAVGEPPAGFRVLIIGAGLSGLCAAVKLRAAGIEYTVIEKDAEVGGTWWENVYPGCGVDTPSHLYSFAFAPNTKWSRYFAKRDEVEDYLVHLADTYDVRENILFDTEVSRARYDEATATWGLSQSLSVMPTARSIARAGARSYPSVTSWERGFIGSVMAQH